MKSTKSKSPQSLINYLVSAFLLVVFLAVLIIFMNNSKETISSQSLKYLDVNLPQEERVDDLLSQMTIAEKIGQMALVEKNSLGDIADISRYGIGGVLSGAGAKPENNNVSGWREMISSFQTEAATTRLGIPLLYGVDAVHGHALVPGATVFPHQIGLGATGDADLVEKIAQATAQDIQTTGVNWNYAPNLDLPTDIRWGRVYEAFSDDPLLVSRLGAAYVKGLQSPATGNSPAPVLATLKHFVGVGAMQWNSSLNKNFKIDQGVTEGDLTKLHQVYLLPFKAAVDAGAMSVMVGLNVWDDEKLVTNKNIITDELKIGLGFKGFVVSDWYGIYEGAGNKFIATIKAVNAGVDVVMLPFDYKTFVRHMTWANRFGLISDERIDDAARRILRAKFTLGLFDGASQSDVLDFTDNSKLARQAVAQSLVLLKNDGMVLPLPKNLTNIKVAGSAADNVGLQSGAWTVEWQGVSGNSLDNSQSVLSGIKEKVALGTKVEYSSTGEFADIDKKTPLGIAVVGETPYAEGWGDRDYPVLSDSDLQAIKNLQATCTKVVVVLVTGRPLLIENEVDTWDALVAAWLPGTQGGGVADVLFGDQKFMGTLPLPWPKTSEQLPVASSGQTTDGSTVLFPRYFGLSY